MQDITAKNKFQSFLMMLTALISGVFFTSIKFVWVFGGFEFTMLIIIPILVLISGIVFNFFIAPKWAYIVGYSLNGLIFLFSLVLFIANLPNAPHAWSNFIIMLPMFLGGLLILFGWYFLPKLSNKTVATAILISVASVFILGVCGAITPFYFVSTPIVFDGGDNFVVEFITSTNGVGSVTVEGDQTTYFDVSDGVRRANTRVHKVSIPKDKLYGKTYVASARSTVVATTNKTYFGASISSKPIKFKALNDSGANFISVSDVHSQLGGIDKVLTKLDEQNIELDFIVFNGDILSVAGNTRDIERILIGGMARYSKGQIPVYFIRGNHDVMGAAAANLSQYIVTPNDDKMYYTFTYGKNIAGIVLDIGSDKKDDHKQLSGLGDYDKYRQEQTQWLDGAIDQVKELPTKIQFSHIPLCTTSSNYGSAPSDWIKKLNGNVAFGISGHTHKFVKNEATQARSFAIYEDGGNGKDMLGRTIKVALVQISGSSVKISSYDQDGVKTAA